MANDRGNRPEEPHKATSADTASGDFDPGLLEDSLSKSPWERMLANDDALNFAESLRNAMEMRDAKS